MFKKENDSTGYRPYFTVDEQEPPIAESTSWNSYDDEPIKKKKKVSFTRGTLALLIIVCLLLSSVCGFGGALAYNTLFGSSPIASSNQTVSTGTTANTTGYTLESATGSTMTIQQITDAAQPSVVEIRTEGIMSDSWMQQYVTQGAGSGVIISSDGYIMTNNHVICKNDNMTVAESISVRTRDGKDYEAEVIGTDAQADVAVIKIEAEDLTAATFGDSDTLEVGDEVIIVGSQGIAEVTIDEMAYKLDTIPYEIAIGFSHRLERVYV